MTKDFDARNEKKSRSVCAAMAEAADAGKRVLSEKERRILDMWPRYEDGEPVWFGDGAAVNVGNIAIEAIEFTDGCAYVKDGACGDYNTLVQVFKHVKRPAPEVLDADGVPIKVGDTVWHEDGSELHVIGFGDVQDGETMLVVEYAAGPIKWGEVRCLSVTHTRPDSWEQLEEDARKGACEYAGAYLKRDTIDSHECDGCRCDADGYGPTCEQQMALDIIRRAKKLAGVE
ncbi:MAG: hypothetical protein ACLT5H_02130 [Collinsella stercoris]|uniref:hypothetical protein n=1 Tax=Collinsella stercoris TaxID=147206 RepID=UPI00399608BB